MILGLLIIALAEALLLTFVNFIVREDSLTIWWVITACSTVTIIGSTIGGASLVGSSLKRRQRLNLLPGAIQGATYLGGHLWLWQMVFMALLAVSVVNYFCNCSHPHT